MAPPPLVLFGGDRPWNIQSGWTASDDRVRGGRSQSHLAAAGEDGGGASRHGARFFGNLDITALGGAGFASQRTTGALDWDLSRYSGLVVQVARGDGKKYTLTLKDDIPPKRGDGRDQSTVSWEYDFIGDEGEIVIPWVDFKPTYRGKPKPETEPLCLETIQRMSFMMRSFFGNQQGDFELVIQSVSASMGKSRDSNSNSKSNSNRASSTSSEGSTDEVADFKEGVHQSFRASKTPGGSSWRSLLCGCFSSRSHP